MLNIIKIKNKINLKNIKFFLIVVSILSILFFDKKLGLFLLTINNKNTKIFWTIITNSLSLIPLFLLIANFIYIFLIIKNHAKEKTILYKKKLKNIVYGLNATIILYYVIKYLKYFAGRIRPYYLKFSFNTNKTFLFFQKNDISNSFPSGHSATAWGFAVFLIFFFEIKNKKLIRIIYFWALSVSISRMFLGMHYLSDVIFGGLIGFYSMKNILSLLKEKNVLD